MTKKDGMAGNIGDWSEPYVFLKILGEGKLHIADENLQKMEIFYPILKILRQEEKKFEYILSDDKASIKIETENEEYDAISAEEFKKTAEIIYNTIENGVSSTFKIDEVTHFLNNIGIKTLKAKSDSKADIILVIHDLKTNLDSKVSFSIKSRLGGAPSLLNASDSTNFVYKIDLLKKADIEEINSITSRSKIRDRVKKIKELNGKITFAGVGNSVFEGNLMLIDSKFPKLMAYAVYLYYSEGLAKIETLTEKVKEKDICNQGKYENAYYEHNMKEFLTSVALGLVPNTKWSGKIDATGGCITVKENGDVLCYHIYNRNEFQEYLYKNTRLDTPSSTRHDFGKIYEENGEYFIRLNLQIRYEK